MNRNSVVRKMPADAFQALKDEQFRNREARRMSHSDRRQAILLALRGTRITGIANRLGLDAELISAALRQYGALDWQRYVYEGGAEIDTISLQMANAKRRADGCWVGVEFFWK
ncbi:MAG: hypothetical protein R3D68_07105 [Hyphomicrobiaceae bacterium]